MKTTHQNGKAETKGRKEPGTTEVQSRQTDPEWPVIKRAAEAFVSVAGTIDKEMMGLNHIGFLGPDEVPDDDVIHEVYKRRGLLKAIVSCVRQLQGLGVKPKFKRKNPTTTDLEALRVELEQQLSRCQSSEASTPHGATSHSA